jgi:hypothetical protein
VVIVFLRAPGHRRPGRHSDFIAASAGEGAEATRLIIASCAAVVLEKLDPLLGQREMVALQVYTLPMEDLLMSGKLSGESAP